MERRDKTINGRLYSILLPPPLKALPLCNKVGVLIAPILAKIGSQFKIGTGSAQEQAQKLLAPMLESLGEALQGLEPDKLSAVMTEAALISKLSYNEELIHQQSTFDKHFAQYPGDMYQVMIWCVWESVKDFFPEATAFFQIMKGVAKESISPQTGQETTG